MVIYDLTCEFGHEFEGWFKNNEDLVAQQNSGLLRCPICNSENVVKKPTASKVAKKSNMQLVSHSTKQDFITGSDDKNHDFQHVQQLLGHVHQFIDDNFKDVGNKFSEEVMNIHNGDKEVANIRGTANQQQLQELNEAGIDILPVPPKPIDKKKLN